MGLPHLACTGQPALKKFQGPPSWSTRGKSSKSGHHAPLTCPLLGAPGFSLDCLAPLFPSMGPCQDAAFWKSVVQEIDHGWRFPGAGHFGVLFGAWEGG